MKLGILVNTDRHLRHIVEIARAACGKGHAVVIFVMDEGVRLLGEPTFRALARLEGVSVSFCDHSARRHGVDTQALGDGIAQGSQLNNAMMAHEADRVIVV